MDFNTTPQRENIYYLTEEKPVFSTVYIAARKKENRILSDEEVKKLPYLNRHEWPLRVKSTERILSYIDTKKNALQILDIGCGNGWFSNKLSEISKENKVVGLDINQNELEQANRVFKKENLQFVYGDIFEIDATFSQQFDIIILNGAVQYFSNFKALLSTLLSFLKPHGEIHIIDSPFYKKEAIINAQLRTLTYYTKLGFPEMASNYFHHVVSELETFEILYKYKKNFIYKILGKKDSPFSWYRLIKK